MYILSLRLPQFYWRGRGGGGEPKNEALLFQFTVDIHSQNAHKTQQLQKRALCAFI